MKYELKPTTQFKKDLKLASKQGKNLDKLFEVIEMIANDLPLPEKNRDHNLTGLFAGCRECHVEPDWLLIYQKDVKTVILYLVRTGSHSDLF